MLRYLDGYLESGILWKSLITHILNKMGFTKNTHDRTIYRDVYKTTVETIYLIRQVGDFSLAFSNEYIS